MHDEPLNKGYALEIPGGVHHMVTLAWPSLLKDSTVTKPNFRDTKKPPMISHPGHTAIAMAWDLSPSTLHRLLEVINTLNSSCTDVLSNWMWPWNSVCDVRLHWNRTDFSVVFWCVHVTRRHSYPEVHGTWPFWQGGLIIGLDCWLTFKEKNLFESLWPFSDPS